MNTKPLLLFALLFFTLPLTEAANFSKDAAITWLDNKTTSLESTQDAAWSLLALHDNNIDINSRLQAFLQQNPDKNCYPAGNCNIKETAFGLLALHGLGEPTENAITWLEGKEKVARTQGSWLIQIISTGQGVCRITHEGAALRVTVNGSINQVKIDNRVVDWIDVQQDMQVSIDQPTEEFEVDCTDLGGSTIISLLRNFKGAGEEFRIIQQEDTNKATLKLKDVCYGESGCSREETFWASWALFLAGEPINTLQYLKDNARTNLEYAILYDISQDKRYADTLLASQNPAGSWDNDILATSLVAFSLRDKPDNKVEVSLNWLKSKQRNDGSLGTQFETAAILHFALAADTLPRISKGGSAGAYCGDNVVQPELGEICDGTADTKKEGASEDCLALCTTACECKKIECRADEDCLAGKFCNTKTNECISPDTKVQCASDDDCPSSYSCDIVARTCKPLPEEKKEKKCSTNRDCAADEICDFETETCIAKSAASCGDGICSRDEDEESCKEDCSQPSTEKKSFWWVWLLVFLLGLSILIWIFYRRATKQPEEPASYFGNEEPKPHKPLHKKHPEKEYWNQEQLEQQIDSSLKEAQDLLKKK